MFYRLQQIDEICVRSNFVYSEVSKPISIHIDSIRVNKNVENETQISDNLINRSQGFIDFRTKKVPSLLITFAQFMAFHIKNVSLVFLNSDSNWLLHATSSELHLDGSVVHNSKTLLVSAAFHDVQVTIFFHQYLCLLFTNIHSNFSQRFYVIQSKVFIPKPNLSHAWPNLA